jgi:uncharacterized cysteine cluster protein YcgN (CxxCxxCC family)
MPPSAEAAFWKQRPLAELDRAEWESLCDGCAKCCLYRLEDADSGEIHFTNVHCRLLDVDAARCTDYANRSVRVPDCITLTPAVLEDPSWLPATCAYRLVAEGKDLPAWHPLVSGRADSVREAGHQVSGRAICEDDADALELHLVDWIK